MITMHITKEEKKRLMTRRAVDLVSGLQDVVKKAISEERSVYISQNYDMETELRCGMQVTEPTGAQTITIEIGEKGSGEY